MQDIKNKMEDELYVVRTVTTVFVWQIFISDWKAVNIYNYTIIIIIYYYVFLR
jgi:hypothetical protein